MVKIVNRGLLDCRYSYNQYGLDSQRWESTIQETIVRGLNMSLMYDSLFNGSRKPLSNELQTEYDAMTQKLEAQIAKMSDKEKEIEWARIKAEPQATQATQATAKMIVEKYTADEILNASRKEIANARKVAKSFGFNYLLSVDSDPKTAKSNKANKGFYTAIQYFAPGKKSGFQVCSSAGSCLNPCLDTAGNPIYQPAKDKARSARTRFYFMARKSYLILLVAEIRSFVAKCEKLGLKPAIRLNGTSDILWESYGWLFEEFSEVVFYDYTKHTKRMRLDWKLPGNYYLTFSRQLENHDDTLRIAHSGRNVAVVFRKKNLPTSWNGLPVINGDETDLRFLDPFGGYVVGLSAKGKAKKDTSGFVMENEISWPSSAVV